MQKIVFCNEPDGPVYPAGTIEPKDVTVYMHDSGMVCTHDYACPVCRENSAILNLSTGIMQPCSDCEDEGYKVVKHKPGWWENLMNTLFGGH